MTRRLPPGTAIPPLIVRAPREQVQAIRPARPVAGVVDQLTERAAERVSAAKDALRAGNLRRADTELDKAAGYLARANGR